MTSTTVDALKSLYVALGGTASDVAELTLIPDVINAIAGLGSIKASGAMVSDETGDITISTEGDFYVNAREVKIEASSDAQFGSTGSTTYIESVGDMELNASGGVVLANDKIVLTEE